MIVDTSGWGLVAITGGDSERFLQGLTTVNIAAIAEARPSWGAILSPKGRVVTVFSLERRAHELWLRCQADLLDKTRAVLERYAVMDDVTFEPRSVASHRLWQRPEDVWQAPFLDGAPPGEVDEAAIERARIRGGFLRYGQDVDEECFPFETPLSAFLDYQKGCYVGQEPVFRVHAQGGAARTLRGLVVEGAAPLASGTAVSHSAKERAGHVTSATPDGDKTIALAYLHRTCWEIGGTVTVAGRAATVHALPF